MRGCARAVQVTPTVVLASHGISDWEAEEVIFNGFVARPNKKVHGPVRYQLAGRTDGGRALLLIVHVFGERKMRVLKDGRYDESGEAATDG